jgi:hypothetical protein
MEALKAECTPEERAESYKVFSNGIRASLYAQPPPGSPTLLQATGNSKLKVGVKANNKELVRVAADLYTKGLLEGCSDHKLNAVLLCNRAHAESLLGESLLGKPGARSCLRGTAHDPLTGNWHKVLEDARRALALDPSNVKVLGKLRRWLHSSCAWLQLAHHASACMPVPRRLTSELHDPRAS